MNQENAFRAVLGVGFLAVLAITLYHRIKSWAAKEALDRRQEGLFILATLRPVGLLLWLGVIAYLVNPAWMAWSSGALPAWLRWTGVALFAIGVGLLTWTLRALGTNLTDTVVTRRAHTLVTHCPYRWVRHPVYDAMALLILAIALIAANWFVLGAGAVVCALLAVRTQTEEAKLLARFGEAYGAYRQRTGRFVPTFALALPLLMITLSCGPALHSGAREAVVVERLYFGRNVADTLVVTDSAWAAFVTEVITPRFPAGLTVWSATGQWRQPDGRIQREPSFVLELVLPNRPHDHDAAIVAIVAEYKRRFRQEAVLRVVTPARAGHD